jgi:hypothetical protein
MSNRGGGRSDGKGGSSGNAPPPAPSPSDANNQTEPAAAKAPEQAPPVEQTLPAGASSPTAEGVGSSGNAPPPAPSPSDAAADASASGAPPKEPHAAQPVVNAARTARLKIAGYTRPSLEEFVAAGYDAANYESYFDKHEAGLESQLEERTAAAKLVPPQPGWIRCRAIKTCLVRGMVKASGEEFWLSEEEALRAIDKGSAEPI